MNRSATHAHLKPLSPYREIFTDGMVPIQSILPIQPRDDNAPDCYLVDAEYLTDHQIHQLAELLYEQWKPECESVEMAIAYIQDGLPMNCAWFSGVSTSDLQMLSLIL